MFCFYEKEIFRYVCFYEKECTNFFDDKANCRQDWIILMTKKIIKQSLTTQVIVMCSMQPFI